MLNEQFVNHIVRGEAEPGNEGGKPFLDCKWSEGILQQLVANIEKSSKIEIFHETLEASKGNTQRVQLIEKYFEWISVDEPILQCLRKNSDISTRFREEGNSFYKDKKLERALELYNMAIAYAPEGSDQISLALANRSAILMALELHDLCLRDIELALKYGYPEKLRGKLIERSKKCKSSKNNEITERSERIKRCKEYKDGILFNIKSPNSEKGLSSAESFLTIKTDPVKGRSLVLEENVTPGTVLIVEEPFVKVLKGELCWEFDHCHSCFQRMHSAGIPCPTCVFAMFCDEKCLEEAKSSHHKYECTSLPYLHLAEIPRYAQLSLRIICKLGPQYLFDLFRSLHCPESFHHPLNNSYFPIYNLCSFPEHLNSLQLYSNSVQSLQMTRILENCTDFFSGSHFGPEFRTFVATMILHHLTSIPFNSYSLDEFAFPHDSPDLIRDLTREDIQKSKRVQFGAGVFAAASLLNHSCNPNVTRIVDKDRGRMSIVSLKNLKSGDELLTNYSVSFLSEEFEERKAYLKSTYSFICGCSPCTEKWPFLDTLISEERSASVGGGVRFLCSKCWKKLSALSDESSAALGKIALNRKGRCPNCKKSFNPQALKGEMDLIYRNNFYFAYELVLENRGVEALDYIIITLNYFQRNLVPPFSKAFMAQDILKQTLDLIVYNS